MEIRATALQKKAAQTETMPTEVYEQLQVLKTQMITGGSEALKKRLRQLEETVNQRMTGQGKFSTEPIFKQASLYLKAEDELAAGRLDEALSYYLRILRVDGHSQLALRASLQLADLFYSELGNFKEARAYYQRCREPGAAEALTSPERERAAKQLDRLEQYKDGDWQPLHLLYVMGHEGWPEKLTALRTLIALPGVAPLLPEAARTLLDRMNAAKPPAEAILETYNLLAKQAKEAQNGDIRAWLELALGDMTSMHLDPQQAIEHYYRTIAASEKSEAAKLARTKLDELVEHNLAESVRNRK
jgi:tetratricopeptide (TPR) repeat protein